ncbi:Peptidase S53 propeptide, partial [mine drainage metagenome]
MIELGGGYRTTDLAAFFHGLQIAPPTVRTVSVDGGANSPTGDPNGPDGEVELDLEVAGSCAPGAALTAFFAPNTDRGFLDAVARAVHDTALPSSIVSISWGGPEPSWTAQALAAFNAAFQDAAVLGVTVTVAAGDGGATDGGPAGTLEVDFPASSPYVLACGGTRLLLSGNVIDAETVWNDLSTGDGATGGGVSRIFPRP